MWMFGPATPIYLPGNGWKELSPHRAGPDGREDIQPLPPYEDRLRFLLLEKTPPNNTLTRLRSAWRHFLDLCHGCSAVDLSVLPEPSAGIGHWQPLESNNREMAVSSLSP